MSRYQFVVLSNPVAGREDEYNDWYTNTHLNDLLKLEGCVGAQRFRLTEQQRSDVPSPWRYLAIYDFETDDLQKAIDEMKAKRGGSEMPISDAMDPNMSAYFFEPITGRKTKA